MSKRKDIEWAIQDVALTEDHTHRTGNDMGRTCPACDKERAVIWELGRIAGLRWAASNWQNDRDGFLAQADRLARKVRGKG